MASRSKQTKTHSAGCDRPLYDLLGIAQEASPAEIQRAYRLRAREVHPDKNPESATAAEDFRQVHAAYETLIDPERRACYDKLGDGGLEEGSDAAETLRNFVKSRFRPISAEDIAAFEGEYKDSAEERCDLAAFMRKTHGDVSTLFEHVICSEPGDLKRFERIIQELLSTGEVPATMRAAVDKSLPKLRRAAAALARRGRKEKHEAEASAETVPAGLADLALQIRERQRQRGWASSLVSEIEAKYGAAVAAKPQRNVRKRPAAAIQS